MTELLTAAQMRAIEQAAIASGQVTGLELMERAGAGVVAAVLEEWPELALTAHRAVVLCGPGNNGGDGFVVARLLRERGWEVEVFLYGDPEKLPPDARVNYERWSEHGPAHNLLSSMAKVAQLGPRAHLTVDALFGTGLARPLDESFREVIRDLFNDANFSLEMSEGRDGHLVAVDIPSGICADSGRALARAFPTDLVVTFHAPKLGHHLGDVPSWARLRTVDIGLSQQWTRATHVSGGRMFANELVNLNPRCYVGKVLGHKFSHGHALILSGPATHTGAARLAARGALRIGAGLVTVAAPSDALAEHAARLDAIMLRRVDGAEGLADLLKDDRITALCLGPALGLDDRAAGLVAAALGLAPEGPPPPSPPHEGEGRHPSPGDVLGDGDETAPQAAPLPLVGRGWGRGAPGAGPRPTVLDADALTLLARHPHLFAALHKDCVLTPHGGEFARLFPDIAAKLAEPATKGPAYSKVDATREAAARAGCVVLYKGPDTVIASPDGRCSINSAAYDRAAPWLATAGSGDVLAGFIAGLMARGFAPMQVAETAAWLHVEAARSFGPGLIAEDLPEELPKVFRALGL